MGHRAFGGKKKKEASLRRGGGKKKMVRRKGRRGGGGIKKGYGGPLPQKGSYQKKGEYADQKWFWGGGSRSGRKGSSKNEIGRLSGKRKGKNGRGGSCKREVSGKGDNFWGEYGKAGPVVV